MKFCWLILWVHMAGVALFGQAKAPAVAPKPELSRPPVITLPLVPRDHIRDFQMEWDHWEIENQKMLTQIEHNKARQSELMDAVKGVVFDYATEQKIDLNVYQFEPGPIQLVPRVTTPDKK